MAKASKPKTPIAVALVLIDEPSLAMRETFDEQKLGELADSMREVGLLQAIGLTRKTDRYEISFGHRRFLAARLLGWTEIRAVIFDAGDADAEAMKAHENAIREDVNAAEEAAYLAKLFTDRCDQDVDRLCQLTKHKRAYVEQRLVLFAGDPNVLDAVRAGQISMSVALLLNKIKRDDARAMYLQSAVAGGASTRTVRGWIAQAEAFDALQGDNPPPANVAPAPPAQPIGSSLVCVCCQSNDAVYEMELVYLHRSCRTRVLDPLLARMHHPALALSAEKGK